MRLIEFSAIALALGLAQSGTALANSMTSVDERIDALVLATAPGTTDDEDPDPDVECVDSEDGIYCYDKFEMHDCLVMGDAEACCNVDEEYCSSDTPSDRPRFTTEDESETGVQMILILPAADDAPTGPRLPDLSRLNGLVTPPAPAAPTTPSDAVPD